MVVTLVASLVLLTHLAGPANAATAAPDVSVSLRYGCGHDEGSFVEALLTPGAGILDGSEPGVVQVGLASSQTDDDLYPDGGPTLVSLTEGRALVRLAGPVTAGQHVFVRAYGSTTYANYALPASCREVPATDFGLADPDVYGSRQVNCVGTTASLKLTVANNNAKTVGYTVLLVRRDGRLSGTQPQGLPVPLAGEAKQEVTLVQPGTKISSRYQVRVIAPDGLSVDVAEITMHCDTTQPGPPHPTVTPSVLPPSSPSSQPSSVPSSSHRPPPTHTPGHPSPRPSASAPASSSSHVSVGSGHPSGNPPAGGGVGAVTSGSAGGTAGGGTGSSVGAPVLGGAATTARPRVLEPSPSPTSSKRIIEAQRFSTIFVPPGFAGAALLVLLGFAGAMGALLAANRASSSRR